MNKTLSSLTLGFLGFNSPIASPAPVKTVDGVLDSFHQNLIDLKEVQEREMADADNLEAQAKALQAQAIEARREAGRAAQAHAKISDLLGLN